MATRSLIKVYKKHGQVIDKGWDKIMHEISLFENSYVKVGLPENCEVSSASKKGSHSSVSEMSELVIIAAANEYGTKRIPERSFIRSTFDENKSHINDKVNVLYTRIVDMRETTQEALDKLGLWFVGKVKRKITTLKEPPNAETTIKMKKSSNPLIDTGQMRNSIQHKVFLNQGKRI